MERKKAGMFKEFQEFYKHLVDFKGRARRREYWVSYMWNLAIMIAIMTILYAGLFLILDFESGSYRFNVLGIILCAVSGIGLCIFTIVYMIGSLSICVRRCHDIGKSGWFVLLCMVGSLLCGIGGIAWFVISCIDSQPEINQWGPNPKAIENNQYDNSKGIIASVLVCVLSYVIMMVIVAVMTVLVAAIGY